MKSVKKIILVIFSILIFITGEASASKLDPVLEMLDLSGFLRMRTWYASSTIKVPDKFPAGGYQHAIYQDLFFRNRINLNILPELEIRTVFDISSKFGKGDFALGSGESNIITRDIYVVFRPTDNGELSLGLRPFSLPGGYILARDATGVQYKHQIMKKKVSLYGFFINAFDDADDIFSDSTAPPKYKKDNVAVAGADLNFIADLVTKAYYVFELDKYAHDEYDPDEDNREGVLNWFGIHNNYSLGNFLFSLGGIINFGSIKTREGTGLPLVKTDILAGLWELMIGYKFNSAMIAVAAQGATGNPNNKESGSSFQDIKASHGFSYIGVDNSGGIAIRGSGESPWYGLCGQGIRFQYTLFDAILLRISLLDFQTMRKISWNGSSSTWFGDELNIGAEYRYKEVLSIFMTAGAFLPQDAYRGLDAVQDSSKGVIVEVMIGAKVSY